MPRRDSYTGISTRRRAAACAALSSHICRHQSGAGERGFGFCGCCAVCPCCFTFLVGHGLQSPHTTSSLQPLSALPLNILLAYTGVRTCPGRDEGTIIGGGDALQQVQPKCTPPVSHPPIARVAVPHSVRAQLTLRQFTGAGAALNISGLACICVGIVTYFWLLWRQARAAEAAAEQQSHAARDSCGHSLGLSGSAL